MEKQELYEVSLSLLAKLSAVVVHLEEWLSDDSHPNDKIALETALYDPEVQEWVRIMETLALAPLKRSLQRPM